MLLDAAAATIPDEYYYAGALPQWTQRADYAGYDDGTSVTSIATIDSVLYVTFQQGTVDMYDLASGSWSHLQPIPNSPAAPVALSIAGKLYVFDVQAPAVEFLDPATGQWTTAATLSAGGSPAFAGAVVNGHAFLMLDSQTQGYDPMEKSFTAHPAMNPPRSHIGVAAVGTNIYVAGGRGGTNYYGSNFQVYSTTSGTWQDLPNIPIGQYDAEAVAINGKVYVFGSSFPVIQEYDPAAGTRAVAGQTPEPAATFLVGSFGNKVFLIGTTFQLGGLDQNLWQGFARQLSIFIHR